MPAVCPNCSAPMKINTSERVARCGSCGTECLVQNLVQDSSDLLRSHIMKIEQLLADGDFRNARIECDVTTGFYPEEAKIYFYMLLISMKCRNIRELSEQNSVIDQNSFYLKAMKYADAKLKAELTDCSNKIIARLDAKQRKLDKEQEFILMNPRKGDFINFGFIYGDPVTWEVLAVNGNKALILSHRGIGVKEYNNSNTPVTWEKCSLRQWINTNFLGDCFTPSQRARILPSMVINKANPEYGTPAGSTTTDKMFLLSTEEVHSYLTLRELRRNLVPWWLRTPGRFDTMASVVNKGMSDPVDLAGPETTNRSILVRPAMWITLDPAHTKATTLCSNCRSEIPVDLSCQTIVCPSCKCEISVDGILNYDSAKYKDQPDAASEPAIQELYAKLSKGDFEEVLNAGRTILETSPSNAEVYLCMLMADLKCRTREELPLQSRSVDESEYYYLIKNTGDKKILSELSDYVHSYNYRENMVQNAKQANPGVGDEICVGAFAERPIRWKVLTKNGDSALLITRDVFFFEQFVPSLCNTTWAESQLRYTLNNDFVNCCFNDRERGRIVPVLVNTDANARFGTPGGEDTNDLVFLPSVDDARTLFKDAIARSTYVEWWLRTPGDANDRFAFVGEGGEIVEDGTYVDCVLGVRPVMVYRVGS